MSRILKLIKFNLSDFLGRMSKPFYPFPHLYPELAILPQPKNEIPKNIKSPIPPYPQLPPFRRRRLHRIQSWNSSS